MTAVGQLEPGFGERVAAALAMSRPVLSQPVNVNRE
jgi:hypothetical protein